MKKTVLTLKGAKGLSWIDPALSSFSCHCMVGT